ncbi:KTSC domain-containing protein [Clostridiaceae bacterium 35-E11]
MKQTKICANNLDFIGYDPSNQVLEIKFISGEVYHHYNVPSFIYDALVNADYPGYYLHAHVRNHYPYQQVD